MMPIQEGPLVHSRSPCDTSTAVVAAAQAYFATRHRASILNHQRISRTTDSAARPEYYPGQEIQSQTLNRMGSHRWRKRVGSANSNLRRACERGGVGSAHQVGDQRVVFLRYAKSQSRSLDSRVKAQATGCREGFETHEARMKTRGEWVGGRRRQCRTIARASAEDVSREAPDFASSHPRILTALWWKEGRKDEMIFRFCNPNPKYTKSSCSRFRTVQGVVVFSRHSSPK